MIITLTCPKSVWEAKRPIVYYSVLFDWNLGLKIFFSKLEYKNAMRYIFWAFACFYPAKSVGEPISNHNSMDTLFDGYIMVIFLLQILIDV